MDEVSKFRLTGAIIWLVLLVVLSPIWFGEPVHFKPDHYVLPDKSAERPLLKRVGEPLEGASHPVVGLPEQKIATKNVRQEEVKVDKSPKKQWIVRIIAYKNMKDANGLLGRLEMDYEVMIKSFENSGMHSVRVGPYFSKAKAEQARQKLDKMLHTQAEVVQLK
ncbi:hypothetical protein MNBD_GAMMA04-1524 [hydrothermal vent metagenome]|uniref:SPOR domain-containing protein n=1 Tax=hydrothermal vent metagenome TaxID=652676 RepID=A0A3B0VTY8_9ZZZZ